MNSGTGKVLGTTLDVQMLVDNRRALRDTGQVLEAVGRPCILRGTTSLSWKQGTGCSLGGNWED